MFDEKPMENQSSLTEDRMPRVTLRIATSTMIKVTCQPPDWVWHPMGLPREQTQ